jgi:hypothetical protein
MYIRNVLPLSSAWLVREKRGKRTTALSFPFEPTAAAGEGYGIVHDHLTDVEVAVEPFLDVFVVCEGLGSETGARSHEWVLLASLDPLSVWNSTTGPR